MRSLRQRRGAVRPALLFALLGIALIAFAWSVVFALGAKPNDKTQDSPAWISLGTQGEKPGQFQQPRGITGFPDGSFVVVDRAARVQHFASDGTPLRLFSMKDHDLGNPKGLAALPNGNLLICDTHYGRLLEMSVAGEMIKQWGGYGTGPAQFTHPLSTAVDPVRQVAYVVEYHGHNDRVQKFKVDGTFIKQWGTFGSGPGQFQRPSGITLDAYGNVFVADAVNHRIQRFDCEGNLQKIFGSEGSEPGQLRYPYDIAYAPDGFLYVAEFNNHRVSIFDTEGKFIRCFGRAGSAPNEFANPWSIGVDANGRVLVADTGNHRVQIYDPKRGEIGLAVNKQAAMVKPQANLDGRR